jgi:hypothetical protein
MPVPALWARVWDVKTSILVPIIVAFDAGQIEKGRVGSLRVKV